MTELLDKKVRYSKGERKAFAILVRHRRPLSTVDMIDKIYGRHQPRPYHARQVILGLLTSLGKKAKENGEPFVVQRTQRKGPHPVEFWLENQ